MIDLELLRKQPDIVARAIKHKSSEVDLDLLIRYDSRFRMLLTEAENLRAERNKLSKTMKGRMPNLETISRSKKIKQKLADTEILLIDAKHKFMELYKQVPNIPTDDTPIGYSEEDNVVELTWGKPRVFSFSPKNHYEIALERNWIDKERAAKVAGARSAYLRGGIVQLQMALMNFALDKLTDESFIQSIITEKNLPLPSNPFIPILPPFFIRTHLFDAMDRLEPANDRYKIEGQDLWLQGSAEHVLGAMHADEILEESDAPVRYVGFATSFRKEAGAAGKDMEGIIRLHQFDKLEMESFSTPEKSLHEHLLHVTIQERIMQILELPYQKIRKCTFDIGKPNAKGSDINVWLPGQCRYRETHTADYMTDYQTRRLNTRIRRANRDLEFLHTNDATVLAFGRTMVAIIENYQCEDCSILTPKALIPYLKRQTI